MMSEQPVDSSAAEIEREAFCGPDCGPNCEHAAQCCLCDVEDEGDDDDDDDDDSCSVASSQISDEYPESDGWEPEVMDDDSEYEYKSEAEDSEEFASDSEETVSEVEDEVKDTDFEQNMDPAADWVENVYDLNGDGTEYLDHLYNDVGLSRAVIQELFGDKLSDKAKELMRSYFDD